MNICSYLTQWLHIRRTNRVAIEKATEQKASLFLPYDDYVMSPITSSVEHFLHVVLYMSRQDQEEAIKRVHVRIH